MTNHLEQHHLCSLKDHNSGFPNLPSNATAWIRFKWHLKKYTTINEKYPKAGVYFKSRASILYERKRHLRSKYNYIIHPFSLQRLHWEAIMFIIYLLSLCFFPWMIAFEPYKNYTGFALFLDVLCLSDVVLNFFTGIYKRTYWEVVLDAKKISRNYIYSYLIVDVLSSIPLDFYRRFGYNHFTPVRVFRLLKIFRLPTMFDYLSTTMTVLKVPYSRFYKLVKFNFVCVLVLHWTGCVHFIVPNIMAERRGYWHEQSWIWQAGLTKDDPNYVRYVYGLFRAACCIFCVDFPAPKAKEDIILTWISFIFGKLFGAYLLVVWLQIFLVRFGNEAKHQDIIAQLNEYMRSEKLPLDIQKRILSYYNYRYKDGYFRQSSINATLSDNLRREISFYCCKSLLRNVNIFRDLPDRILKEMVRRMDSEIYLPNDIIVKAGSIGRCMYFLVSGTVAVFTANGKEICHLEDGAFFGEIALMVKDHKRVATVSALEICTVYTLDRRYFMHAFESYPELLSLIQEEANYRMENTVRMEAIHKKLLEAPDKRLLLRSSQHR